MTCRVVTTIILLVVSSIEWSTSTATGINQVFTTTSPRVPSSSSSAPSPSPSPASSPKPTGGIVETGSPTHPSLKKSLTTLSTLPHGSIEIRSTSSTWTKAATTSTWGKKMSNRNWYKDTVDLRGPFFWNFFFFFNFVIWHIVSKKDLLKILRNTRVIYKISLNWIRQRAKFWIANYNMWT